MDDNHGYYILKKEDLDRIEMEMMKEEHCRLYRKDDCYGCIYYDPEDQVCMFDK